MTSFVSGLGFMFMLLGEGGRYKVLGLVQGVGCIVQALGWRLRDELTNVTQSTLSCRLGFEVSSYVNSISILIHVTHQPNWDHRKPWPLNIKCGTNHGVNLIDHFEIC